MERNKQIVQELYENMSAGNLSKVLPVLDEHLKIRVPKLLPFGGEFLGREGFIAMVSKISQTWEYLKLKYLHYYLPEGNNEEQLLVQGKMEGKAFKADAPYTFQFINQWRLKDHRIIEHSVFFDDTIELLQYLNKYTNDADDQDNL